MPRIFDNIDQFRFRLWKTASRSPNERISVGYFNLRGWRLIDRLIEGWVGGDEGCVRLLVGTAT